MRSAEESVTIDPVRAGAAARLGAAGRSRAVNRSIRELSDWSCWMLDFVCECPDESCWQVVRLSAGDFDAICAASGCFLVLAGHERDCHEIVADRGSYLVVSDPGEADHDRWDFDRRDAPA